MLFRSHSLAVGILNRLNLTIEGSLGYFGCGLIDGPNIHITGRVGWSCAEKDVLEAARSAGTDSPILFVFVRRQSAEDVRRLIVEADAAQQTLDTKGNPTTAEGQEARQSMDSRRARAMGDRDQLIRDVVDNARVFQGGGSEVLLTSLDDRIKAATEASLVRLFPRFKEADSAVWDAVIKRARDGADHPFQPTGHADATEKHPVCHQVVTTIGAGKSGSDVRKTLGGTPFGWPRDAVDGALIALHRLQHLSATSNGQAIPLGQLDQNKIAKTDFRVEHATLTVGERLILRKLFQAMGLSCKSGEEAVRAGEFLSGLITLAKSAGGDAPLPLSPATTEIEDIQRLVGNEQLVAIKVKAPEWEDEITAWTATRDSMTKRLPTWNLVERLAKHVAAISQAKSHLEQIEAIRSQRILLEKSDPASAIRIALAGLLRDAVQKGCADYERAFNAAMVSLGGNSDWVRVAPVDQEAIKTAVGLGAPSKPDITNDDALLRHLDQKPLSNIQAEIDAIAGRVALAIERAARLLEPKVRTVMLERSTLRDAAEVEAWIERQTATLIEAVRHGPVLVN